MEVLSDFPNESAFDSSIVKIHQKSIDFRESIDYQAGTALKAHNYV